MTFAIGIINIHTVQMLFLIQSVFAHFGSPMIYTIIVLFEK